MGWILSAFADEAGGSTAEQMAACGVGGLVYIDPRNVDGHNISELPLDRAEAVAKQYEAAGVRVNMYGSPIGKLDIADDLQIDLEKVGEKRLPYPDNSVELTLCSHILEHLHNFPDLMNELHRVTKPGGVLTVFVPNRFHQDWLRSHFRGELEAGILAEIDSALKTVFSIT